MSPVRKRRGQDQLRSEWQKHREEIKKDDSGSEDELDLKTARKVLHTTEPSE